MLNPAYFTRYARNAKVLFPCIHAAVGGEIKYEELLHESETQNREKTIGKIRIIIIDDRGDELYYTFNFDGKTAKIHARMHTTAAKRCIKEYPCFKPWPYSKKR